MLGARFMSEPGDIWERYDAKVLHIRELEAKLVALEKDMAAVQHERDHWARVGRQLNRRLQVARALAERLRLAQRADATPAPSRQGELPASPAEPAGLRGELDRAREVLGLVLTALTKALDDDDEAVAELGRRLRHHAGGKLLQSITRGGLTLVPVDGRYMVDRTWLARLDLAALRGELDVAAQSGVYPVPADASIVHTNPGTLRAPAAVFRPPTHLPEPDPTDDLQVDLDGLDLDAYDDSEDLPPPPPMTTSGVYPPPPLIPALPPEELGAARTELPRPVEPTRGPSEDTVRTRVTTQPLAEVLIPNLRIGRLIKTPSGG